ncbi:MAG: PDZ domain-containing protein [Parachlamydiaceae bacterium]|nr:PDZ domain-containing protein [Parachlamydiaceae bacterium]
MLRFLGVFVFSIFMFLFANCQAREEQLKVQDIAKVMQQIFEQHLDQKEISVATLRQSLSVYIDQFDPERVYLLEEEVRPFLNVPDAKLNAIIEQYRRGTFGIFEELNKVIQKSIYRSRVIRNKIERTPAKLFIQKPHAIEVEERRDPDLKRPFAKNEVELEGRITREIINYIDAERRRFGDSTVFSHEPQTLALFEKNSSEKENHYLYKDENDQALSVEERESLFAMHILKSLASSLDAHTSFYSQSEAFDVKTRLQKGFQGIGIVLTQAPDNSIYISDLAPQGPAAKSGQVKIGDRLVEVNDQKVNTLPFDKITELMRGDKGTNIKLGILRKSEDGNTSPDKTLLVVLKREEITLQEDRVDTSFQKFDHGVIGVITLHSFYQGINGVNSEQDMIKAIEQLKSQGNLLGIILDLRENSGGFLGQAVKVAGLFITNGVIVISKYFNGEEHFFRDLDGKSYFDGPLIVLTSRATASAAEIVAQALQDYGVALIVGDEQTYGKGTIQNQTVTDNKSTSFFKVTVGRYYTVSGKTPQIEGVKADVVVPGIFNFEHLGERYLASTVPADTIPEDYDDNFEDVTLASKPWFTRYYLPTLQHKKMQWINMLPTLKKHSIQRMASNKGYQKFLQRLQNIKEDPNGDDNHRDYQLLEASEILKEMIKNSKVQTSI